ncbi:MAG TPA: transcription elongation factor GreA [Candidatus Portnoybacteria bacterium]|nr:transcription elongation factor GreA [Candidatus Portnoybacteria bacterium]
MKITPEGLKKMKEELKTLISKREEISKRISEAKDLGDLSENAEYSQAREAQSLNESKIAQIEETIKNAEVVSMPDHSSAIQVGSKVKIKSEEKERDLMVVGSQESDPLNSKISDQSPLGKILIGRKEGEMVEINTPRGKVKYKIIEVK